MDCAILFLYSLISSSLFIDLLPCRFAYNYSLAYFFKKYKVKPKQKIPKKTENSQQTLFLLTVVIKVTVSQR